MVRKYLYGVVAFVLAFGILLISLLRSSTVNFALADFKSSPSPQPTQLPDIDYTMTLPGNVLPDSVLWPLKAIRDRVWYMLTFSHLGRAELALLFADKRLVAGVSLFEKNNSVLGLSTVTKGEKYLEMAVSEEELARKSGADTSTFLTKLAASSLKHRQIIEGNMIPKAPEDVRPSLSQLETYSKTAFTDARDALVSMGKDAPKNPFDGQ